MNWYYASQNERRGPVASAVLRSLLADQTIDRDTLVWREGLPAWVALSSVQDEVVNGSKPAGASTPPAAGTPAPRCVECGLLFPRAEILELEGRCVCAGCKPVFLQKLREGVPVGGGLGVWRRQRDLVVALKAPLPDRCVKCNCAAQGRRLKRPLYWHHPAIYIMIVFPGLIFYALVAVLVRKRATLEIGLCEEHRSGRTRALLITWSLILAGVGSIVAGASSLEGNPAAIAVAGGIFLILAASIGGVITTRVIHARKIDKKHVFVGGVCPAYLDELPEFLES